MHIVDKSERDRRITQRLSQEDWVADSAWYREIGWLDEEEIRTAKALEANQIE